MPLAADQQFNPYVPPTPLDIAELPAIPLEKAKRPISVWLMQILLYTLVGLFAMGLFTGMRDAVGMGLSNLNFWRVLLSTLCVIGLIACTTWTAISLYRRRNWSKWVCLCLLLLLLAFIVLSPNTTYYANDAQRIGGFIGRYLFFSVLLIWWMYALAFSKKARRYFKTDSAMDGIE